MSDKSSLVVLTPDELRELVRAAVAEELEKQRLPNEVLTLDEAAELLKLNPKKLASHVDDYQIPAHKVGPQWRFRRSELLEWLSNRSAA